MRTETVLASTKRSPLKFRMLAMTALACATGIATITSAVAAETNKYQTKGKTADLSTSFTSGDGCENVNIYLNASESVTKSGPGAPVAQPGGSLSVSKFNFCTGASEWGYGELTLQTLSIDNQLSSADAVGTATITMCNNFDTCYTENFNVDVNWTSTAPKYSYSGNNRYVFGGVRVHSRYRGTSREASVTGTISNASTTYTLPGDWTWASISSNQSGYMEIIKN